MTSHELNPKLKEALYALPSIYELQDRERRDPDGLDAAKTTLPLSVDAFADVTTPLGAPIVGRLDAPGVYEIEYGAWYPDPNHPAFFAPQHPIAVGHARIQLKDLGDEIETSLWNAHVIRRELLGNPPPTIADIKLLYKRELEDRRPEESPFIALNDGVTFGDFIENYPMSIGKYEPNTDDEDVFFDEMKLVILRPDFYMDLERFLKRKGVVRECDAVSPEALYHEGSGFLRVSDEGDWGASGAWINLGWHLTENPEVMGLYERPSDVELNDSTS